MTQPATPPTRPTPPTLRDFVVYFLKLGTTGFGGPIALVGYMQRDLVEDRKWVSPEDYKEGLALAQLAPGPLAAQLAIYLGWVKAGVLGATVVGIAFVVPSFLMVMALSAAYLRFGGISWMPPEKVRRWRTIQRLYGGGLLGGEVRLQPRRQPLRPVVEACMDRFRLTLARRGNVLSLEWDVRKAPPLLFDADAVDLYAAGERLCWSDPFRSIHGEGLGLLIVRSLMTAHGGSVTHECRAETAGGREETRPYGVRLVTSPRDEV